MSIMQLLFGFRGTIDRGTYIAVWLANVLALAVAWIVLLYEPTMLLLRQIQAGDGEAIVAAILSILMTFVFALGAYWPIVLGALVVHNWISLALFWKRARAAGFGSGFRWSYVGVVYGGAIVPMVGILMHCAALIMWLMMVFFPTRYREGEVDASVFGEGTSQEDRAPAGPATGLAALDSAEAMRRRAAQLGGQSNERAPRAGAAAPPALVGTRTSSNHSVPRGGATSGFGRRSKPAFGRR